MIGDTELERDYTLSRKPGWFARATSPPRTAPARYTRSQLAALGGTERRRYDDHRAVWHANLGPIVTSQMQSLFEQFDEIVLSNRQDGDRVRGSAVLSALPGLGKSTAAICYGVRYHRDQVELHGPSTPDGHDRVPVVYLGADLQHDDAQPELRVVPLLRAPGVGEGECEPAGRPGDRLRAVLPDPADHH